MTTVSGGGGRQPTAASLGGAGVSAARAVPGEVQPVFVQRAALQTLPGVGASSFMGYDIWGTTDPAAGATVIGAAAPGGGVTTVPAQQALDISEISFVWLTAPLGGWMTAAPDYTFVAMAVYFSTVIGEKSPWDQFTLLPVFGRVPGWSVLNQNVLASWSDTPVHLVVPPGQTVYFVYTKNALIPAPYDVGAVGVRFRGRWLPEKLWREIIRLGDQ